MVGSAYYWPNTAIEEIFYCLEAENNFNHPGDKIAVLSIFMPILRTAINN